MEDVQVPQSELTPAVTARLEKNLNLLLFQKALITCYFHLPIIVLFWQDLGLSMFQIMTLQASFSIATVMLELPSGIFADLYGRKKALNIAAACNVAGILVYCFADTFMLLLIGELLLAGFVALQSGADSAMLYDNLKALNREAEYSKRFGNMIFVGTSVLGICNIAGGFVGAVDLRWPIFLCLPPLFAAFIVSLQLTEPPRSSRQVRPIMAQLKEVLDVVHLDSWLKWVIIYAGVILAFNQAGLWLYQPYFSLTGIEVMYFGLIFASFQFVTAFAGKYYYVAKRYFGEPKIILGLIVATCAASLLMGQVLFLFSFSFIFLQQVVRAFSKIMFSDMINRRVSSEIRASVLSVQNLVGRIITAMIVPFFGYFADIYTIEATFTLIGITGLICGLPVWYLLSRKVR